MDLDAMVKNAPDSGSTERQRRLAFALWIEERVAQAQRRGSRLTERSAPGIETAPLVATPRDRAVPVSVRRGPGLFLEDDVALDREHAPAVAEIQELDQLRVDVQLVAVLAQPAGDAEAQPLAPIRQPERRVEAGDDEAPAAAGAAISQARHRVHLRVASTGMADDLDWMLGTVVRR